MAVSRRLISRGLVGIRAGPVWGGGKLRLSDSDRHQRRDFSYQFRRFRDGDIDGGCRERWKGIGSEGPEVHSVIR